MGRKDDCRLKEHLWVHESKKKNFFYGFALRLPWVKTKPVSNARQALPLDKLYERGAARHPPHSPASHLQTPQQKSAIAPPTIQQRLHQQVQESRTEIWALQVTVTASPPTSLDDGTMSRERTFGWRRHWIPSDISGRGIRRLPGAQADRTVAAGQGVFRLDEWILCCSFPTPLLPHPVQTLNGTAKGWQSHQLPPWVSISAFRPESFLKTRTISGEIRRPVLTKLSQSVLLCSLKKKKKNWMEEKGRLKCWIYSCHWYSLTASLSFEMRSMPLGPGSPT